MYVTPPVWTLDWLAESWLQMAYDDVTTNAQSRNRTIRTYMRLILDAMGDRKFAHRKIDYNVQNFTSKYSQNIHEKN